MIKKLFIASLLIVALPVSAQTGPNSGWAASIGTGQNNVNQTTVNQTPGATLSTPNASVGVPGSVGGYTPLEPILNQWGGTRYNSFSDYLATIYRLVITIGALIAVVMLVTGGVRYMLSEGFTDIDKAKLRIRSALTGLLILVGSFLILYTINPNLLRFDLLIPPLKNQGQSGFSVPTGGSGGSAQGSTRAIDGYPGAVIGTATGAEMRQAAELLGSRLVDDRYVLFDPSKMSSAQLSATIKSHKEYCEGTGVVSTLSLGTIHYYSRTVPGSVVGAPGQTALVCADNP